MGVTQPVRVAVVQMDVAMGRIEANLQRVLERLVEARHSGARLVVFPECALSGYCFASAEAARPYALPATQTDHAGLAKPLQGGPLAAFAEACSSSGIVGVLGFLEAGASGSLFNSALVAGNGLVRPLVYRKTHLPLLGVDRFVVRGDDLPVFETGIARIGVLICYDVRLPEPARVLTLRGADVLALPTNWPDGAETAPEYVLRARARENRIFVVAANRVGAEEGSRFIGRSQIVAPDGSVLAWAGAEEEIILADIDPCVARTKRVVIRPGEFEQDTVGDRRPELYGDLAR